MPALDLVIAPHPVYKEKSTPVDGMTPDIKMLLDDMMDTLEAYDAIGVAAPMVGISKQLVVIKLEQDGEIHSLQMANPRIIHASKEMTTLDEASITFPDVVTAITRPSEITVEYLGTDGQTHRLDAKGLLATCIQHEMDYLDGRTLLDYLSPMKRDIALRRMKKASKHHHHHVHSAFCNH
ncbi:peptide deformylase [bacterium]|nr:peptide deformylase [bacterium]